MNQTWSRIIDMKKSSFASVEFTVGRSLGPTIPATWLQYKLEDVIAKRHHGLLTSPGSCKQHRNLCRMLHGHVFPSVHSISLCIRIDAARRPDSKNSASEAITRANIERLSSSLNAALSMSFPKVRYLQTDLTDTSKTPRNIFLSGIVDAYSHTLRRLSLFDQVTKAMARRLESIPLQFIEISADSFGGKEVELVRRSSQTLQILRRQSGYMGIPKQILTSDAGIPIIYPNLHRLEVDTLPDLDDIGGPVSAYKCTVHHFPRLKYFQSSNGIAPEIATAALAAVDTLRYLSFEHDDECYRHLRDRISTPQGLFSALQHLGTSAPFLCIGTQAQYFSYDIDHIVCEGALSALSLNLPDLRILKASRLEMGIADLLYLVNQLPALYHLTLPYSMDRILSRCPDELTDERISGIREELPAIQASRLQKLTLTDTCGIDNNHHRVLRTNCLLAIAFTKLPLLATVIMEVHRRSEFPETALSLDCFVHRPIFDDSSHIRQIEYIGF
ncbi:hypothetical protein DL89DRAFT_289148 [Linderina pennispora]|uniref:Uncharacterized protein n=1 Tax=Linderina pennispora TaxID=61395 RepID=A0A1Y1VQG1_9FUNG|nr:uncharacterized protein DL89DRAFT_289148 [Linderina pennispora]ORX63509.1 hypothetical protein DL89DRAFT_289148 [Linderina pennispora]